MSYLVTGAGPFLNSEGVEDIKNQGSEAFQVWEGTPAQVIAKRAELLAAGATNVRYESKGDGSYTVRGSWPFDSITGGTPESYVDTLELETNLTQKSVYQSPIYRTWFSDYSSGYSAKANKTCSIVARAYQILTTLQPTIAKTPTGSVVVPVPSYKYNGTSYATAEEAAQAYLDAKLVAASLTTTEQNAARNLFYEVAYMGVTSFWEYGTVFRRTVTAGNPAAIQANYAGVGMIWTSAEVSAYEGIPSGGTGYFVLPAGKQWIKDKPRVLSAYGQKTQISYNYTELATASALHYEAYGTATLFHVP